MEPWAKRIKELLDAGRSRGLTQSGLAKACGRQQPSLSQWFNDSESKQATKMIMGDNLLAAAKYLGTTPEWIIYGKASPAVPQETALRQEDAALVDRIRETVKLIGVDRLAAMGSGVRRPDPAILERTHRFMSRDGQYDLSKPDQAKLFASAYEWIASKTIESDESPDNMMLFFRWLEQRGDSEQMPATTATRAAPAEALGDADLIRVLQGFIEADSKQAVPLGKMVKEEGQHSNAKAQVRRAR
jgi:transcriptional regulator with XRE-family HTH domain